MVTIYDHFTAGCIKDCESYFQVHVSEDDIDCTCEEFMKCIDGITKFDKKSGSIQTPFGEARFNDMSTGLKVLIIVYLMIKGTLNKKDVCVDECGNNALIKVLELSKDTDMKLILHRGPFIPCDIRIVYNGEREISFWDFVDIVRGVNDR